MQMVAVHGDNLEVDFARYYHLHLGLLGSGELTWRRFRNLVRGLPAESLYVRGLPDHQRVSPTKPDIGRWPLTDQLLANLIDLTSLANWQRGGGQNQKPKLLTERSSDQPAPRHFDDDQIRAILRSHGPPVT
jgi:hypothetical protein